MPASRRAFLLLYGSEKGQAESIAHDLVATAADKDWDANLFILNDVDKKFFLERTRLPVVIITSTTGDGDAPENAIKFERRIKRRTLSATWLSQLHFTVLGLGDSNYANFCNCGKTLDRRLSELGANRFYDSAWADDGVGLDLTIEPWLEGLWPALDAHWKSRATAKDSIAVVANESNGVAEHSPAEEKEAVKVEELTQDFSRLEVSADKADRPLLGDAEAAALGISGEAALSVPPPSPPFLRVETLPDGAAEARVDPVVDPPTRLCTKFALPSAPAEERLRAARVESVERISSLEALKCTLLARVRVLDDSFAFQPGDSLGLVVPNPPGEVAALLDRLGVAASDADRALRLSLMPDTRNRRAALPAFMPPAGASLRQLLVHFCDVRAPPDKLLLRVLAEHTTGAAERRRLLELCSAGGRQLYERCVRAPGLSLLDTLRAFPTCRPPVGRLLERLKQLMPRPYSAACAPRHTGAPELFEFAANLVEMEAEGARAARRGVATGWLAEQMYGSPRPVWIYRRRNETFHLPPENDSATAGRPLVMIGPGTGVAPFRAFLQHLAASESAARPDAWLFFGCRHRQRDWLFSAEMEEWRRSGVLTRLSLAFSRETEGTTGEAAAPRYVQDCMRAERAELGRWLWDRQAVVFVCGDAAGMAKDVRQCLAEILTEHCAGGDAKEGERLFARLRLDGRYLEDVWT